MAILAVVCGGTRAHSFKWAPVLHDTQERSPCTIYEIAAHTRTAVPSTGAISSVGGMPLGLMAPARVSRTSLCGWL